MGCMSSVQPRRHWVIALDEVEVPVVDLVLLLHTLERDLILVSPHPVIVGFWFSHWCIVLSSFFEFMAFSIHRCLMSDSSSGRW